MVALAAAFRRGKMGIPALTRTISRIRTATASSRTKSQSPLFENPLDNPSPWSDHYFCRKNAASALRGLRSCRVNRVKGPKGRNRHDPSITPSVAKKYCRLRIARCSRNASDRQGTSRCHSYRASHAVDRFSWTARRVCRHGHQARRGRGQCGWRCYGPEN